MSDESELKKQVWVLENEKKGLVQQVERLENRLKEYVTWSEQAQKILEENKDKITSLENQNKVFSQKVNQGTVAMSNNLLEENSTLKRKNQELLEQFLELNEILDPLVMNNILDIDAKTRKKLISAFSKSTNDKRIIALFLEDPSASLTLSQIETRSRISSNDCIAILKRFIIEVFIRESGNQVYKTLAAIGDKIISSKDLSRVSTEALFNYIVEQIKSTIDTSMHITYLDVYSRELAKRGENSLSQKILAIRGELYMAKRSSEWIIDKIVEATEVTPSVPFTSRQASPGRKMTSTRGSFTSTYTTPEVSSRPQFQNPVNQPSTQFLSVDTSEWIKLSNADVIDNLKLQISDKMDYLAVVEGLNALRDHLSSSVGGRALYEINNLINEVKNKKSFDKNEVHNVLVDLMTKV